MSIQVVILAAGQGTRMHSDIPKVLHTIAGKPMLEHVIKTALEVSLSNPPIVIYGHQGELLQQALSSYNVKWVLQKEQAGTGHALLQALPAIQDAEMVLVLYGDVPLISFQTLQKLIAKNTFGILTAQLLNPTGYGRIQRDHQNNVVGIIEEKDASDQEKLINEVNSGIYFMPTALLRKHLPTLSNNNSQKEYYLTDMIRLANEEKILISVSRPEFVEEVFGVNNRVQLSNLERVYQRRLADKLMMQGVTILDPARFDIRGDVQIGKDVVIDVNVILEGFVEIGDRCTIGANCILRNVTIGDGVEIKSNSIIEDAVIGATCHIGPFARIRPGTVLGVGCHIGNFVEIKKSEIGGKTKINHLTYIGDSHVGKEVNIGAGTITCNYDGANKHKTVIKDNAFIGSSTQLVAPVIVGEGATIGAGSTITRDVPAHQLTIARAMQQTIENWQRPVKVK